ncbi:MAG: SemiSWEET transporter [Sphingobacteriales bacterium]|nr:SemiSWEET transporter [Sphingobacteriales bacterium]
MDKLITIIGMLAAIGTTISFLPQALKIIKTKDTKSISLSMYILFVSGVLLWLIYGILKPDLPIMIANGITLILAGIILYFKIKYP